MLALALDDFTVLVVDTETRRVVRKFSGHRGIVNDMVGQVDGSQVAGDENNSRLFFFRLSALMADGWLPWRWTALFVRGISPLEGKEVVLHRLIFGNQTF